MKTQTFKILGLLILAFSLPTIVKAQKYDWQKTNASVVSTGDLVWHPEFFQFETGKIIRYIDYENGNDQNAGNSKDAPWKHHPWDSQAGGNAATSGGIDTYVFKGGVAYRGNLIAKESGTPDNPIRLTMDPGWGKGEAMIYGSEAITGGWQRVDVNAAPGFPQPEKVWYIDLGKGQTPRLVWERRSHMIHRLQIARYPNWQVSNPDDIKSKWLEWDRSETKEMEEGKSNSSRIIAYDNQLPKAEKDAYQGATVWTEYVGVMGTPYAVPVEDYNPENNSLRFEHVYGSGGRPPIGGSRYFLENLPHFLDSPGEFYFAEDGPGAGRLYLRLPDDRDPNETTIEVARRIKMIDVQDKSNIEISGLTFRFQNVFDVHARDFVHEDVTAAGVRAFGNVENFNVKNCIFEHVAKGVHCQAEGDNKFMDNIVISDNVITNFEHAALAVRDGSSWGKKGEDIGVLRRARILRNKIYNGGFRPIRSESAHTLTVTNGELVEVSGNIIDRVAGAGIFLFGGKGADIRHKPLIRILIHHNKVTNPLLNTNDWGGIETWQNGPAYVFNNVSGNPGGYWHFSHRGKKDISKRTHTSARFGFAYYLDGAFKNYHFNNIGWGNNNDLSSPLANSNALQEIIGFMNSFFNNSFYKFAAGSRRQAPMAGRNYYLGNIFQDISEYYFRHANPQFAEADLNRMDALQAGSDEEPYDYQTLAYANNIFHGQPRDFGVFEHTGVLYNSLESFSKALQNYNPKAASIGVQVDKKPMPNAANHDFRPGHTSPAIDHGVKYFVPWSLYGVVGEWHFYANPDDPTKVYGENWHATEEYWNRSMYRFVPLNDLQAENVKKESYVTGALEDWTKGALLLDGSSMYCLMKDEVMKSDYSFDGGDKQKQLTGSYKGEDRLTLDMDTNNFLLEMYLKADAAGTLIAKNNDNTGYQLEMDKKGKITFSVMTGKKDWQVKSKTGILDNQWHHVVAELDRNKGKLNIYLDGKLSTTIRANLENEVSLANTGDFYVGRSEKGGYLKGVIDFVRVSRGSLADAQTDIGELYEWQFNGPFLHDFNDREPRGRRDAGAIEFVE